MSAAVTPFSPLWVCCPSLWPVRISTHSWRAQQKAQAAYNNPNMEENDCYKYAAIRNILYNKGKTTEVMVSYEPCYTLMNEWWKQLYGESEGKDGKGLFPGIR